MERGKECEVRIVFDLSKVTFEQVCGLEDALLAMGVHFDTGTGLCEGGGSRDWEWDYSLQGPVKVIFKGDREVLAAERKERAGYDVRNREGFDKQACGVPTCRECCKVACTQR